MTEMAMHVSYIFELALDHRDLALHVVVLHERARNVGHPARLDGIHVLGAGLRREKGKDTRPSTDIEHDLKHQSCQ